MVFARTQPREARKVELGQIDRWIRKDGPPFPTNRQTYSLKIFEILGSVGSLVVPVESMNLPVAYNSALVAQ